MKKNTLLGHVAVTALLAFNTPASAQNGDANGSNTANTETTTTRDNNDDHGKWGLAGLLGLLGRRKQEVHHTGNNPNVNR